MIEQIRPTTKGGGMNLNNNIQKRTIWNHFLKRNVVKQIPISQFFLQNSFLKKENEEKAKMDCQTTIPLDQKTNFKPAKRKKTNFLLNKQGQGLIEYLILIALMGVATIGIIRTLNQTVKSRFANATYALQGQKSKSKNTQYEKRGIPKE